MIASKVFSLLGAAAASVALATTGVTFEIPAQSAGSTVVDAPSTQGGVPAATSKDCGFKSLYVSPSLSGAKSGDLIAVRQNGELWRYPSKIGGGFSTGWKIGQGWGSMTSIVFPGDLNRDGQPDLVAVDSLGNLHFYPGNGRGGFGRSVVIGHGWKNLTLAAVGDMNGDGVGDLVGIKPTGELLGYAGTGKGTVRSYGQIGRGWKTLSLVAGARAGKNTGGFWGINAGGDLFYWGTNGRGGPKGGAKVGHGWRGFRQVMGGADLTGNGLADLLVWKTDGTLFLYPGAGAGAVRKAVQVGRGFSQHSTICPAPVTARHVVKYQVAFKGSVGASAADFAALADQILNSPNGWARASIRFEQVKSGGAFTLWLSEDRYLPSFSRICSTYYSCSVGNNVIINLDRWLSGTAIKMSIGDYRNMVINHEVGHWLGWGHSYCPGAGQTAPLMMQQSKGLNGCVGNPYPLPRELKTPRFG